MSVGNETLIDFGSNNDIDVMSIKNLVCRKTKNFYVGYDDQLMA